MKPSTLITIVASIAIISAPPVAAVDPIRSALIHVLNTPERMFRKILNKPPDKGCSQQTFQQPGCVLPYEAGLHHLSREGKCLWSTQGAVGSFVFNCNVRVQYFKEPKPDQWTSKACNNPKDMLDEIIVPANTCVPVMDGEYFIKAFPISQGETEKLATAWSKDQVNAGGEASGDLQDYNDRQAYNEQQGRNEQQGYEDEQSRNKAIASALVAIPNRGPPNA